MIQRTPILVYHRVLPESEPRATGIVRADTFDRQMRFLAARGYRTWTIAALLELAERGESPPPRSVALTFDDATADHWTCVFPILERHRLKATFFVPTGLVEDGPPRPTLLEGCGTQGTAAPATRGHMRWSELERVARSGLVDVESHGHLHLQPRSPEDDLERAAALCTLAGDLRRSRELLGARLGREARILAWPHGVASAEMCGCAAAVGFRLTLATQTPQPGSAELLLHRRHFGETYEGPFRERVHYWRFVQTVESGARDGWRWRLVHAAAAFARALARQPRGAA